MRSKNFSFLSIFVVLLFSGQKKQCFCAENPEMNTATISCETTILKNGAKLYWQYNCEKIWLTLENKKKKIQIDQIDVSDFGITYRIGYHFIKEYERSVLFRRGCGATGPCSYILIDKNTGKKLKEFNQLIAIDTDVKMDDPQPYSFPFVVYLSTETADLIVYFIDAQKTIKVPFKGKLTFIIPENQFIEMKIIDNSVIITYQAENGKNKAIKVNLKTEHQHN